MVSAAMVLLIEAADGAARECSTGVLYASTLRNSLYVALALLVSGGCIAHAPERFAGPDVVMVTGDRPSWPITVVEDEWGVPHVQARNELDAAFALGWLHGEERLWQLELSRRVGSGRLSEILGRRTLQTDRFLRTVGFRRAAEAAWPALPEREQEMLQAYADGINAFIAATDELPPEFRLLRFEPEPWQPVDSLVITKSMAWLLSGSADEDALFHRISRELGDDLADVLVPTYPPDGLRILPPDQMRDLRSPPTSPSPPPATAPAESTPEPAGSPATEGRRLLDDLLGKGPDVGSNAWVVDGTLTNTGLPILANDPHLGVQVPAIWYLAEVETPDLHVVGPTLVGLPGFPIGHNEHIAWGLTNSGIDVLDLYRERPHPDDPSQVERPGGTWEQLEVVVEEIAVKGRAKPVLLEVRIGSHGPLVTEFFEGDFEEGEEVAMRWAALDPGDTTIAAFFGVMRASDWQEFREALRLFVAPSQNFIFADTAGHVGWKVPGRVPLRHDSFDGRRPGRGWVAEDAWQGWIPYDELPEAFDPLQGWVVTANQHPVSDDYPHHLGSRFTAPHRAMRIVDLLEQGEGRDMAGHRRIQMDTLSAQVPELKPVLLRVPPTSELVAAALQVVRSWNGEHDVDSAGAAIFNAWLVEVATRVVAEPLDGAIARRVYGLNPLLVGALFTPRGEALCRTEGRTGRPATDDCDELAAVALDAAVRRLRKELGPDPFEWRWGELHTIRYHHPLAFVPSLKKSLDTELEAPGGPATVNVGPFPLSRPFVQTWHPSYRQVVDLSDWNNSVWIGSLGQSGVPWRAHYRDMAAPYVAGEMLPMLFGRDAVEPHAVRTRQLRR